jgi:hypothetical protein
MRIEKLAFSSSFSLHVDSLLFTRLSYIIGFEGKERGKELEQLMCDVYFLVVGAVLHNTACTDTSELFIGILCPGCLSILK